MKYLICSLFIFLSVGLFSQEVQMEKAAADDGIEWMTWEEAIAANAKEPKKIFIDIYTEW